LKGYGCTLDTVQLNTGVMIELFKTYYYF